MLNVTTFVIFALLGTLGGFAHMLIDAGSWEDLKEFGTFKGVLIGTIVGFLYTFLYSDHDFPNSVMTFVAGYCGTDFIEGLITKYVQKKTPT